MAGANLRDAASLIIYRHQQNRLQALMGKRSDQAKFAPGIYVFPGGNIETEDGKIHTAPGFNTSGLSARAAKKLPLLALTAIRETWEETGLMVAQKGQQLQASGTSWDAFSNLGLSPAPHRLEYLGRAITPTYSSTRFHARFFATEWKNCEGEIQSDGELSNIRWVDITNPENLPMYDVTEYMLDQLNSMLNAQTTKNLVVSYRLNETLLRYE